MIRPRESSRYRSIKLERFHLRGLPLIVVYESVALLLLVIKMSGIRPVIGRIAADILILFPGFHIRTVGHILDPQPVGPFPFPEITAEKEAADTGQGCCGDNKWCRFVHRAENSDMLVCRGQSPFS